LLVGAYIQFDVLLQSRNRIFDFREFLKALLVAFFPFLENPSSNNSKSWIIFLLNFVIQKNPIIYAGWYRSLISDVLKRLSVAFVFVFG